MSERKGRKKTREREKRWSESSVRRDARTGLRHETRKGPLPPSRPNPPPDAQILLPNVQAGVKRRPKSRRHPQPLCKNEAGCCFWSCKGEEGPTLKEGRLGLEAPRDQKVAEPFGPHRAIVTRGEILVSRLSLFSSLTESNQSETEKWLLSAK